MIGGLFLRDTFSRPPCTLIQPSMQADVENLVQLPEFAKNFCPPIYPLEELRWQSTADVPLICLHSLQVMPSPAPPSFASKTVIACQPLMIHLQEESCLRISSFLADGIVVNPGDVLPDSSINSMILNLKELDVSIPLDVGASSNQADSRNSMVDSSFTGAKLHLENLSFSESPSLRPKLLNLEKDPACFCLWEGQPIDASQKKWIATVSLISLSLETRSNLTGSLNSCGLTLGSWRCVELKHSSIEVAMVSSDGRPLCAIPPPGGVVRVGIACEQYLSNSSVEQLFFVLDLYTYFGRVGEKIASVGKNRRLNANRNECSSGRLMDKVPCDTAVCLALKNLQLRFLESSATDAEGLPLVQFIGEDLFIKVSHRTLGGAIAISSTLHWQSVEVDCVDTDRSLFHENDTVSGSVENGLLVAENGYHQLRTVFWVHKEIKNKRNCIGNANPFLDVSMVHVMPFSEEDRECHSLCVSACISGVRLGGGMNYAEALMHRFGVLGPDGGPGEGLTKGLGYIAKGPLSKLFKASPLLIDDFGDGGSGDGGDTGVLQLGMPDDVDLCIELKDWLFALEGAQEMAERWWFSTQGDVGREQRSWHATFQSLLVKAKSDAKHEVDGRAKLSRIHKYPVELVTVGVEGLQILKPQGQKGISVSSNGIKEVVEAPGGINVEIHVVTSEQSADDEMANWMVENLKFSVKQPMEAVVTKDELQHLALLCKSEVDAMGRITAGILRLLKLEKALGRAAIDQLGNLGTEGFDRIFTSERNSRGSSPCSIGFSPSTNMTSLSLPSTVESTVASLEEAVSESQSKCSALVNDIIISRSEPCNEHMSDLKQLSEKLESIQQLVMRLRSQI
ncbi:hypothetical protein K2173_009260 [Erythroxylum novogranatense]|uniref:Uncharacterized protein n=1 Tax=Erythroxylum novogranatense TaxID=1862640 RepID=A0AAV8S5S8_9ROSI|nr:hypothetical protein K2173_009260 [Erythroxylum novogranatense]